MAFNVPGPVHYDTDYQGFADLFTNAIKERQAINKGGYENQIKAEEARYAPQNQKAALEKALLENKYYAPKAEADIAHRQIENQFGGLGGTGKNAVALELLKKRVGENHPLYLKAKEAVDRDIANQQSLMASRDMYTRTGDKRAATSLGKAEHEIAEAAAGFRPGTNYSEPISEEEKEFIIGQLENKIVKEASDSSTRSRVLYANNIDTTLSRFKPEDLVQYSGVAGGIKKKLEEGRALSGKESKEYEKYQKALTDVDFLAKQIRQFYGDSIQPRSVEAIKDLVNPEAWITNPRIALSKLKEGIKVLELETENFRKPLRSPKSYGIKTGNKDNEQAEALRNAAPQNGTSTFMVNGKSYTVPVNLKEEFLADHPEAGVE